MGEAAVVAATGKRKVEESVGFQAGNRLKEEATVLPVRLVTKVAAEQPNLLGKLDRTCEGSPVPVLFVLKYCCWFWFTILFVLSAFAPFEAGRYEMPQPFLVTVGCLIGAFLFGMSFSASMAFLTAGGEIRQGIPEVRASKTFVRWFFGSFLSILIGGTVGGVLKSILFGYLDFGMLMGAVALVGWLISKTILIKSP